MEEEELEENNRKMKRTMINRMKNNINTSNIISTLNNNHN